MVNKDDARRCELRSLEFGTFELFPGGSLRIGRHRDNDVVLNDSAVSRFHARVTWEASLECPVLFDNGSQNGTHVDANRVRNTATLRDDSKLQIGPFALKIKLFNCNVEPGAPALLRDTGDLVTLFSDGGPDLRGQVTAETPMRDVLLQLETEQRTGTLHISPEGGGAAKILVCLGRVVAASCRDGKDLRALEKILGLKGGRYRFSREVEPQESSLNLWVSDFIRTRRLGRDDQPTETLQRPRPRES